jgi:hypothetical protein
MSPADHEIVLQGNIDSLSEDGVVSGWCWSPDEPDTRRIVSLAIDGFDVVETIAGDARADLAGAGVGDGGHGFHIRLAPGDIPGQPTSVITLRDVATGRMIGSELTVTWPRAAPAPLRLEGNLERASDDGWVSGWAWHPTAPDRRVMLDILVDGVSVGSTRASALRPDLEKAGVGDGKYGFNFALPWSVMAAKGEMRLSVRDAATGQAFGEPVVMRVGRLVDVEDRLNAMERQVRLLQARLVEQAQAADAARDERAARDLFRTVAAFFHDLAEAADPAQPAATMLRHAVGSVLDRHAPFALEVPERPEATVLLLGHGPRAEIYASLVALREAGIDRVADIVLLHDPRQGEDVALLPAIVRNLRYARLKPGADEAAVRNEIAGGARGEYLVVLSSALRPARDAIEILLEALTEAPRLAMAGGLVLREDGRVDHAGFSVDDEGELAERGAGADPDEAGSLDPSSVDAVADLFFAARRSTLLELGGFPLGYAEPDRAVAGLCFALRAQGHDVTIRPQARATRAAGVARRRAPAIEDMRRLRDWRVRNSPPSHGEEGELGDQAG